MPAHGKRPVGPLTFDAELLGRSLRELREGRGMSASDVAAATGITRQGISNLEAGTVDPSIKTLEKLFEVFGLTAAELVDLGSSPNERTNIQLSDAMAALQKVDPKMLPVATKILTVLKTAEALPKSNKLRTPSRPGAVRRR